MNQSSKGFLPVSKALIGFTQYKEAEGLSLRSVENYKRDLEKWIEQGAFQFRGCKNGRMKTNEELKAKMLKAVEGELDKAVAARAGGRVMTISDMEELLLPIRARIGELMLTALVDDQEEQVEAQTQTPMSAVNGRLMKRKGKKTK
jgi:hypothetical protein